MTLSQATLANRPPVLRRTSIAVPRSSAPKVVIDLDSEQSNEMSMEDLKLSLSLISRKLREMAPKCRCGCG